MNGIEDILNFLFEAGRLKRVPRTGWQLVGVADCESVADHTSRVAIIGYILALMEGVDPGTVVLMCLLHDFPESRLGDIDASDHAWEGESARIRKSIRK